MPSPVGHALAGLAVHALLARDDDELWAWPRAGVVVAAALAPDLDLLFRFVDGRNHHNNETHSVGFALVAVVVAVLASRAAGWARPLALGLAAGGGWLSHVLIDYLNLDTNPPIGIMALWPLSRGYFKFPWPIFLDIGRTLDWAMVQKNTLAVAWEVALLGPLVVWVWRARRGQGRTSPN